MIKKFSIQTKGIGKKVINSRFVVILKGKKFSMKEKKKVLNFVQVHTIYSNGISMEI